MLLLDEVLTTTIARQWLLVQQYVVCMFDVSVHLQCKEIQIKLSIEKQFLLKRNKKKNMKKKLKRLFKLEEEEVFFYMPEKKSSKAGVYW